MAYEIPGATAHSFEAAEDLSAAQYKFVKLDSNGKIAAIAAATDAPIGILQEGVALGKMGRVMFSGISKVQANEAITTGARIGTSADGQAAPYVFGAGTTNYIVGTALETSTAAAQIISVAFNCLSAPRGA